MLRPISAINSRRTAQDVIGIVTKASPEDITDTSSSVASNLGSGSGNGNGNGISSNPRLHQWQSAADESWSYNASDKIQVVSSAIPRKPGSRLGLKRVITKSLSDGPPNKRDRDSVPLPEGTRCFSVLFAKPQTKKHKTWENDGYLTLSKDTLTLKNTEGDIISCGRFVGQNLVEGHQFSLGDRIVQVQEELYTSPFAIS